MFTARCDLIPYIKQITFRLKKVKVDVKEVRPGLVRFRTGNNLVFNVQLSLTVLLVSQLN